MTAKPINQIRLVAFTTHPPKVLGRHLPIGSRMEAGRRTGALRRLIIIAIGVLVTSVIAGAGFHLWWSAPSLPTPFKPIAAGSKLASLMSEAKKASRANDHQRSIELYTQALAEEPGPNLISRDLHALRGSEYNFVGSAESAYDDFDAAIRVRYQEMTDQAIRAFMGRGYAELNLRKYAKAKDDFDIVLKQMPDDIPRSSSTLAWRGAAWQGLGDRTRAIADYKAALALDAGNAQALQGLKSLGQRD